MTIYQIRLMKTEISRCDTHPDLNLTDLCSRPASTAGLNSVHHSRDAPSLVIFLRDKVTSGSETICHHAHDHNKTHVNTSVKKIIILHCIKNTLTLFLKPFDSLTFYQLDLIMVFDSE